MVAPLTQACEVTAADLLLPPGCSMAGLFPVPGPEQGVRSRQIDGHLCSHGNPDEGASSFSFPASSFPTPFCSPVLGSFLLTQTFPLQLSFPLPARPFTCPAFFFSLQERLPP